MNSNLFQKFLANTEFDPSTEPLFQGLRGLVNIGMIFLSNKNLAVLLIVRLAELLPMKARSLSILTASGTKKLSKNHFSSCLVLMLVCPEIRLYCLNFKGLEENPIKCTGLVCSLINRWRKSNSRIIFPIRLINVFG